MFEFFGIRNKWTELQDVVIPRLIQSRGKKQLSFGARVRQQAKSHIRLRFCQWRPNLHQIPVLASDIDQGAIAIAKRGHYLKRQLINILKEL